MGKIHLLVILIAGAVSAQSEGYSTNTDGSKTYFRIFGSGKPLLVINGGPGMNSNGFEALARQLAVNRMVVLYDQRGTGKSTLSKLTPETVSMHLMVSDIESLRKSFKVDKWDVLGHSFGGMVASYYATQYPASIDRLVLSSSGGIDLGLLVYVNANIQSRLTPIQRDSLAFWNAQINSGDSSHAARLGRGRNLAPAYVYDKKYVPVLAERLTQGNAVLNQLIWDDLHNIRFNCASELKNFTRPVLIIQGRQDIIKPETADRARRAFKNAKVVILEHCGHYGWLDAKAEYFAQIDSFLQS